MRTGLVVDGDLAVGLTIRRVLERAGFAVIAVPDGPTALRRLASLKMDLVICEIEMPGPAGEAAIVEIGRADPAARILALSHKECRDRQSRSGCAQRAGQRRVSERVSDLEAARSRSRQRLARLRPAQPRATS